MRNNDAMKYQPFREALSPLVFLTKLAEYKERRIEKVLNSNVRVTGCGNVKLNQLFSPSSRGAVVVIRRRDGSYEINLEVCLC